MRLIIGGAAVAEVEGVVRSSVVIAYEGYVSVRCVCIGVDQIILIGIVLPVICAEQGRGENDDI